MASESEDLARLSVPNLSRGLQILEHLASCDEPVGISDITRELKFPTNSVFRIINTLRIHGYAVRDEETKKYTLSSRLLQVARGAQSHRSLAELALPVMRQLRDQTQETVVLSILSQGEGLILEEVPGLHPFRFVCDPGTRQTIHASASTKAIIAHRPEKERDTVVGTMRFPRLTSTTIRGKRAFRKELAEVRRLGYALDRGEALEGVHCVAAPVLDAEGHAVAAVTATGPASRMPLNQLDELGRVAAAHTASISRRLGYDLTIQRIACSA